MQNSKLDLSWANMSADDLKTITGKVQAKLKEFKEEITKISKEDLNFENLIHREEVMSAEIGRLDGALFGYTNLHTDEKIQEVARKVELENSKILSEFVYDEDVYNQFTNYYNGNFKKEKKNLTPEQVKIVEDANKAYKKIGMHLDKKTKKVLLNKINKISKLAQEFQFNHTKSYEKGLWLSKEELEGISENILKSLNFDKKKNKYFVSVRPTVLSEVLDNCNITKTREKITFLDETGVGEKNNRKFREILRLRNEIVKLIGGYKTWGDYVMENEMVNNSQDVKKFLEELGKKISPTADKEKIKMQNFLNKKGEKLATWSYHFAETQLQKQEKNVNTDLYKPYFELNATIEVLFKIWKDYFGIEAKFIQDKKTFHTDTSVYSFTDLKSGDLLGYGALDLFPRKLKYGHACVADIFKKYKNMENELQKSFTFLICNFQKGEDVTLLSFNDVNTLFHEAGHMLHMILMKNNYISTGATSRDFVEIPSQFHENFLLNKHFLRQNFKHYQTKEIMGEELLNNFEKLGKKGEAIRWLRQIAYADFDQELNGKNILKYTKDKKVITTLFEKSWKKIVGITASPKREFASKFSHLVGGYDARYYSYVISKVYAQDIWNEFAKNGIKKGEASEKYKKLLEAANTKEEKQIVKEFLGRKVSMKPFLEILKD